MFAATPCLGESSIEKPVSQRCLSLAVGRSLYRGCWTHSASPGALKGASNAANQRRFREGDQILLRLESEVVGDLRQCTVAGTSHSGVFHGEVYKLAPSGVRIEEGGPYCECLGKDTFEKSHLTGPAISTLPFLLSGVESYYGLLLAASVVLRRICTSHLHSRVGIGGMYFGGEWRMLGGHHSMLLS